MKRTRSLWNNAAHGLVRCYIRGRIPWDPTSRTRSSRFAFQIWEDSKGEKAIEGVRIIDAITKSDVGREIETLPMILQMCGVECETFDLHGGVSKADFVGSFGNCEQRFVHVSSHGRKDDFVIKGKKKTLVQPNDFAPIKGSMKNKFLTVLACGTPYLGFLNSLRAVLLFDAFIAQMNLVDFADSALSFLMFYYQINKYEYLKKKSQRDQRMVDFIDAFQKAKMAFFMIGAKGGFRLCYWRDKNTEPVEIF